MDGQPKEPRKNESEQPDINLGGVFVGLVLFVGLIWSLYVGEMTFAYLSLVLLFALAVANYLIGMMYK
jgi:hypothetical protein